MAESQKLVARAVLIVAVVLALATATALWVWNGRRSRTVVLSGTIEAHNVTVGSLVGGRVKAILVQEGDAVRTGQPVATLQTDSIERQMEEQKAAIAFANAQLQKAQAGPRTPEIEKAAAVSQNAERERLRYQAMYRQGIISKESFDAVATQAKTAAHDLELLRQGTRPEDIEAARAQLEQSTARLAVLDQQKNESLVFSPTVGFVQAVGVRPGDLVAPNQGLAEIVESGQLWVRVFVPETEIGLVRVGSPATITVDSFPDRKFTGRVGQINERGEYTPRNIQTRSQRADQVFGVKVMITPDSLLKPGMAAEVDLGVKGKP